MKDEKNKQSLAVFLFFFYNWPSFEICWLLIWHVSAWYFPRQIPEMQIPGLPQHYTPFRAQSPDHHRHGQHTSSPPPLWSRWWVRQSKTNVITPHSPLSEPTTAPPPPNHTQPAPLWGGVVCPCSATYLTTICRCWLTHLGLYTHTHTSHTAHHPPTNPSTTYTYMPDSSCIMKMACSSWQPASQRPVGVRLLCRESCGMFNNASKPETR